MSQSNLTHIVFLAAFVGGNIERGQVQQSWFRYVDIRLGYSFVVNESIWSVRLVHLFSELHPGKGSRSLRNENIRTRR